MPKSWESRNLVYKILDSQAIKDAKKTDGEVDGKRKRIIKINTSTGSEEAEVENQPIEATGKSNKPIIKKTSMPVKKDDKAPVKRTRKKVEEKEVEVEITSGNNAEPETEETEQELKTLDTQLAQAILNENDDSGNQQSADNPSGAGQNKFYPPTKRTTHSLILNLMV